MPEGGKIAGDAELSAKCFESEAGILLDGLAKLGFIAAMKGDASVSRGASFDFAGLFEASDELPNPFGTDRVLASQVGKGQTGLVIRQNPSPKIE